MALPAPYEVRDIGQVIFLRLRFFKYKMVIILVSQNCKHLMLLYNNQQIIPTTKCFILVISLNYHNHPMRGPITSFHRGLVSLLLSGHVWIRSHLSDTRALFLLNPLLPLTLFHC